MNLLVWVLLSLKTPYAAFNAAPSLQEKLEWVSVIEAKRTEMTWFWMESNVKTICSKGNVDLAAPLEVDGSVDPLAEQGSTQRARKGPDKDRLAPRTNRAEC